MGLPRHCTAMRILHLSDTHLGIERLVRGAPGGWSRADDLRQAAATALGPALRGEVDLVLHTGDLFNRSQPPPWAVADAAALLLAVARRVPVVVIPGNHDRRGLARHLPRSRRLIACDAPTRLVFGELALGVVPFVGRAEIWAEAARNVTARGVDLLLAHQAFDGAVVPGRVFRVGQEQDTVGCRHLPAGVQYVACGHIHPRQVLQVGAAAVVQPGSTERTSLVERGQTKGYAVWELGRRVTWRFVDLPGRRMVVVSSEAGIKEVRRGDLCWIAPAFWTPEVERAVSRCGGWLLGPAGPRPAPRAQRERRPERERRVIERQLDLFTPAP